MSGINVTRLALSVAALATFAAAAQAASLAEIKQRGYMVVAVSPEASPFDAIENGKPSGFDAELLETLRRSAPFELREQIVPARDLAAGLQNGAIDLAARSITVTPARQASVAFGPPLAETTLYYLKRRDDDRIHALADLGGRRFGVIAGEATVQALAEVEHHLAKAGGRLGDAVRFDSDAEAYGALASGRVDYVIDEIDDLAAAARREPDAFAIGAPVAQKTYAAWAVAKGNDALAAFVTELLTRERRNGDLAALQQKWLGRSFPDLPDSVVAQDWWTVRDDRPAVLPIPSRKDPD
jgi:polar amino acid transport system substrate-binding protein